MHEDLQDAIETAKRARDGVLDKTMSVPEANAIAANNHTIVGAYTVDLRERIFIYESGQGNIRPALSAPDEGSITKRSRAVRAS